MAGFIESRNGRHRARFTPPGGKEINETFDRKGDATDWLAIQNADSARGTWVDPRGGKTLFGPYAKQWLGDRLHVRGSTTTREEANLRNHILPTFGDRQLRAISRRLVQSWVNSLTASGLAPSTVGAIYELLAKIMRAAVGTDRLMAESPCRGINLPEVDDDEVGIPRTSQLLVVEARLPAQYRRMVSVAKSMGLRYGELAGLTEDRIDFLRRTVKVDRQLQRRQDLKALLDEHGRLPKGKTAVSLGQGLFLVPPKTKRSKREVPVGRFGLEVLAAQLAEFPPADRDVTGMGLLFTSRTGRPVARASFDSAWEKATRKRLVSDPELPDPDEYRAARDPALEPYFSIHALRHVYASLLIERNFSPKRVAACLGDTLEEVLRTYAHLWPDDNDQARRAVDEEFYEADVDGGAEVFTASARPGLAALR